MVIGRMLQFAVFRVVRLPAAVFICLAGLVVISLPSAACDFEKFADVQEIQIGQSPWIVGVWGEACGFGVSGGMEVRALNTRTQETKTIVAFGDIFAQIRLSSDEPNLLTITVPNRVDMQNATKEFDDVKVNYKFTPSDDPEDRANFQRWKHHPEDPQARNWACRNILAKMDPVNRESWNSIMGKSYPIDRVAGNYKYCATNE
jgi:hypothetical protein